MVILRHTMLKLFIYKKGLLVNLMRYYDLLYFDLVSRAVIGQLPGNITVYFPAAVYFPAGFYIFHIFLQKSISKGSQYNKIFSDGLFRKYAVIFSFGQCVSLSFASGKIQPSGKYYCIFPA